MPWLPEDKKEQGELEAWETRAPQWRRLSKTGANVPGRKPHNPLWEPASFILRVQASKKAGANQLYGSSEEKRKEKKLQEVWGPNKEEDSCKADVLKELQGYKATKNGTLKGLQGTVETQETTLL